MNKLEVDPNKVPDLFRRIGMKPARWKTYDARKRQCDLVMAYYIDSLGPNAPSPLELPKFSLGQALGWDKWYVCGLVYGWDGWGKPDIYKSAMANWAKIEQGIRHAREAWYQLEQAGMIPEDKQKHQAA